MIPAISIRLAIFVLITGSFLWPLSTHAQSRDAVAMNNLGVDLAQAERHQEAIETFRNVIRLRPDFANAYYNLGTEYQRLANWSKQSKPSRKPLRSRHAMPGPTTIWARRILIATNTRKRLPLTKGPLPASPLCR